MRTRIKTRFATAKDTAKVLGVSSSRLKKLLATFVDHKESEPRAVTVHFKRSATTTPQKVRGSSGKRTSGKAQKSTR